jgi:RIO-like serine/threonine protein kinase
VNAPAERQVVLKRDQFGSVCCLRNASTSGNSLCVERDTTTAAWWIRWLACRLAAREARALAALERLPGLPRIEAWDGQRLRRSWIAGEPMHRSPPTSPAYFREALRLVRRMHAAGILHNDLAKEPNWLVTPEGSAALVDFQLATRPRIRGLFFRALAYDDLRHLLKHKRRYFPDRLTSRQLAILKRRSVVSALWARTGKPLYRLITRRMLGWADREGAGDR